MAVSRHLRLCCNATIGHELARPAPHFLNPYAILLGFHPVRKQAFSSRAELLLNRIVEEVVMSRIRTLGASVVAIITAVGAAHAADISVYSPPPPEVVYNPTSAYNWNGAYVGAQVGYGWGTAKNAGNSWDANGVTGGIYSGYNFAPTPGFVLGVEGDIAASGMSGKLGGVTVNNNWNGTLRARAGAAVDRFLIYGTGGLAVGGVEVKSGGAKDSATQVGYTLGGGVEAGITNNVTARLEYRWTDLGKDTYSTAPGKVGFTSSQVLFGVGMKF
jgi:outer membrane immunogenic protein